jgi:thiol-disulfide isomerase/thioredoxin
VKRAAVVGVVVGAVVAGGLATAVVLSLDDGAESVGASTRSATASSAPSEPSPTPEAATTPAPDAPPAAPAEPEVSAGAYVDYSDEALAAAEGTRVLFFHAPWCPQCRALEADILASGVPDGVTVLKVDYDSRQDLRQQYGVTLQTTVVALDAAGGATAAFVAYDEPTLAAALSGLGQGG